MYIRFSPSYLTASVLSISILYNVYQQSQNYPFYILYNLYKILSVNLKLYAAVGNFSPIKIGLKFFRFSANLKKLTIFNPHLENS